MPSNRKTIAVAGGTGPVGRTIVDGLLAHEGHDVYVLSRKSGKSSQGVESLAVDYSDVKSLTKMLENHGIDTVICAMGVVTPAANEAQLQLIRAAAQSSCTKRFVVSAFDMLHKREYAPFSDLARFTFEAIDELQSTGLEYTRVVNGFFIDYYGIPHWPTHLHPWINFVNMERAWAVVPGDGTAKANFITSQDMSRFIARLMDLDSWNEVSSIVAETLSIEEVVRLAEDVRERKFKVIHDSLDKLKSGKISMFEEFPPFELGPEKSEALFATVHYQAGMGQFLVPTKGNLKEKFPDIKTMTMRDVMESWRGK